MLTTADTRRPSNLYRGALVAAAFVVLEATLVFSPEPLPLRSLSSNILSLAGDLLVTVLMALASRRAARERAPTRLGWALLAVGFGMLLVGDFVWTLIGSSFAQGSHPAPADYLYAPAYVVFLAAVLALPSGSAVVNDRLGSLVDVLIVLLAALFGWWVLALGPSFRSSDADGITLALSLIYPVGEFALAWSAVRALSRRVAPVERLPILLVSAGIGALVATDLGLGYGLVVSDHPSGCLPDLGYALSSALLGLAAWVRLDGTARREGEPRPVVEVMGEWRALDYLPQVCAAVTYGVLVFGHDRTPLLGLTGLAIGGGLLVGLVLARQLLAMREVRQLYDRVQGSEARYRALVEVQTDLVGRWNPDGARTYVNAAYSKYFQQTPEDMLNGRAFDFLPASEQDAARQRTLAALTPAHPTVTEIFFHQSPEGMDRFIQVTSIGVYDDGRLVEVQSVSRDATDREMARRALEALKAELEQRVEERTAVLADTNERLKAEIVERQQAEEAVQRYTKRVEAMHAVDCSILSAHSLEGIAEAALMHLHGLIPSLWMAVTVIEQSGAEQTVLAHAVNETSLQHRLITAGSRFPVDPLEMHEGVADGQVELIPDLLSWPCHTPLLDSLRSRGTRSYLLVPLLVSSRLIGFLTLGSIEPSAFTDEHVSIAREVADQLALAIQQAQLREALESHAAELEARVAERTAELSQQEASLRETAQALQSANERLKVLDQLKSQFVSNVSHELRTPLANIKLYLSLLERGKQEKRDQYLATLTRETLLLQGLIEDLLNLSRLEMGKARPDLALTDLNGLVKTLVDDRSALACDRGLLLRAELDESLPLVQADEKMLTQVLTNLMANAMNYTLSGGSVTVRTRGQADDGRTWVSLSVCDTGLGISEEDQSHLFERFHRGTAALQTGAAGTGLGLAICQEIVKRHEGWISVKSQLGKGSTFSVWLPVRQTSP